MMSKKFVGLLILDGWGIGKDYPGNAALKANTPNLDAILAKYPHAPMHASGMAVGLPEGQMGNSEVGHMNIGAGRVVYQSLTRITKDIRDGEIETHENLIKAFDHARENGKPLHLLGLTSKGGVHSHLEHLIGLIELAKKHGVKEVYVHAFMDGRDVDPRSGKSDLAELQASMQAIGLGKIATVIGRYYAMDRDNRWDRVQKAYNAMLLGEGTQKADVIQAMEESYAREITDEFIDPTVITENGAPVATINDGDAILFFNFRPDRAREMTRAIVDQEFAGFERKKTIKDYYYACMTQYDKTIQNVHIVYGPESYENTFGEYISQKGLKQLRIAETEKYAHVTFFFNGGVEAPNEGEDRILVKSPDVATYDLKPQMSAEEVKTKAIESIQSGKYDVMILNFANPDMVGHTGIMEAAMAAIEEVDQCVAEIIKEVESIGGKLIITADHGNLEEMLDFETGAPMTAHTTNPVHCIIVGEENISVREGGCLADIAPTMLEMLGVEQPKEMTGQSLIVRK